MDTTNTEGTSVDTLPQRRNRALDGLRGVAVLLVTVSHANVPVIKFGGIVGVTLFFVLSGFLITSLLVKELDRTRTIALGAFYARRALRLLPALLVALLVGTLLAIAVNESARDTVKGALLCLFYVSNLPSLWGTAGGPFGHFWSLAMEEQYYMIWPLVVLLLARVPGRLLALTGGLIVASLALRFSGPFWTRAGYQVAYFSPHTNAWALLMGSAAALLVHSRGRDFAIPAWLFRVAMVGLVLDATVLGMRTGLHEVASPTTYTIRLLAGPIAGVFAIILVLGAVGQRPYGKHLVHPILLFFGSISYGLYLWSGVLGGVLGSQFGARGVRGMAVGLVSAILAVGVAVLSRRYVEAPFLRMKHRFERAR